jgi:hypothetical protein
MPFRYDSMEERIIANTVLAIDSFYDGTPCWLWTGATVTNRSGKRYPKIMVRFKRGPRKGLLRTWLAHRLVLVVFKKRQMSKRTRSLHLCNNTICVNPNHLVGGTQRKNVRQCVREGRHGNAYKAPVRAEEAARAA